MATPRSMTFILSLLLWECMLLYNAASQPLALDCLGLSNRGNREVVVATDEGAVLSGCELRNTNLILLVVVAPRSNLSGNLTIPVAFKNILGVGSSVTVRLLTSGSQLSPTPAPVSLAGRGHVGVSITAENCTLSNAVDAFVVDVNNATDLSDVNLTLRDTTITAATRGAASVYRSASATGITGTTRTASIAVWISLEKSTVEVVGTPTSVRCGSDTVPQGYKDATGSLVPVLCPVYAGSVLLTPPDIPPSISANSYPLLNVSTITITSQDTNVTARTTSGANAYALSAAWTSGASGKIPVASLTVDVRKSVVSSITAGGLAVSGAMVLMERISGTTINLEGTLLRFVAFDSRITGEDTNALAPTIAFGLSVFAVGSTGTNNCSLQIVMKSCDVVANGGAFGGCRRTRSIQRLQ